MTPGRSVRRLGGELDVAAAAREARGLALACGLSAVEAQHVATAVSEIAGNAVKFARGGEVELAPAERGGRRGLTVTVRDAGPGIEDVAAALRDGVSTGGTLGLGLPAARRLMDDFSVESGRTGTVVSMARWAGGRLGPNMPAACAVHDGPGGVPVVQPFRNGLLLAVAAGPRAAEVARAWRTRPWAAPVALADRSRAELDAGQRLGLAVASVSALDGRLAWLRAGGVACALLRGGGRTVLSPPAGPAVGSAGGAAGRADIVDLRRDDLLVMAAAQLDAPALARLAAAGGGPDAPAFLTARFERGALEPRRPGDGPGRRSTMGRP